ncbi:MAG: hypothetical protein V3V28_10150 [Polaribacter sp.]|uniref:hypothetical protein n=1 Tax=Polaribacter sp. TaxID=1920175 RepID=UPI002F35B076
MINLKKSLFTLFFFLNYFYGFSNDVGHGSSEVAFTVFDKINNISISSYWEDNNVYKRLSFKIYKYNIEENPDENNVEFIEQVKVLGIKTKGFKGTILKPIKGILKNNHLYFSTKFNGIYIFDLETKKMKLYFKRSEKNITRDTTEEHLILDFEIHNNNLIIATQKGLELYNLKAKKLIRKISKNTEISKINIDKNPNYLSIKYNNQKYEILSLPSFKKVKEVNNVNYLNILENGKMIYVNDKTNRLTLFNLSNNKNEYNILLNYKLTNVETARTIKIKAYKSSYFAIEQLTREKSKNNSDKGKITRTVLILNLTNGNAIEEFSYYYNSKFKDGVLVNCNKINFLLVDKIEVLSKYAAYYSMPIAHVISVGVGDYIKSLGFSNCSSCEKDALIYEKRIATDYKNLSYEAFLDSLSLPKNYITREKPFGINIKVKGIKTHLLIGENATLNNIRETFKKVIQEAEPNDYFVFIFNGQSEQFSINNRNGSFLMTHLKNTDIKDFNHKERYKSLAEIGMKKWLTVKELASLMNQIPSNK